MRIVFYRLEELLNASSGADVAMTGSWYFVRKTVCGVVTAIASKLVLLTFTDFDIGYAFEILDFSRNS